MSAIPRWMMIVFIAALLGLCMGGAWFFHFQEQQERAQVEAELCAIARLKVDQIVQWRAERLSDAAILQESPFTGQAIREFLVTPRAETMESLLIRFRSLQKHHHYRDVILVDDRGEVRLSTSGRTGVIHQEAAKVLFDAFRERRPLLTDLHAGPAGLPPHVGTIAPFFSGTGEGSEPIGAILLQSEAGEFLYPMIQSWPSPSRSAETLLARRDGDSVLFLNELRHRKDSALELRIPLDRKEVPAVMALLGKEGVMEGMDYRGVEVLSVLHAIPDSPWFMVAKIDRDEALEAWRFRSVLIVLLISGFVAATILAAGMVRQRYAKAHYRELLRAEAARHESEERYRTTLMSIGDAVVVTDAAGRVRLLNPVAEALTGWNHAEARGKPVTEVFNIVNEETRQTVEDPVARVLREGVLVGLANHTVLISRDGEESPIADSAAPITDEAGDITGVVLVFRDQTRERESEKALQALSSRQQALLAAIPDIIMEVDADKVYTWANRAGLDFFGDDVIGKPASHYFEGEQKTCDLVRNLFNGDENVAYVESLQRRQDGRKRLLAWWCRVLKDPSGTVLGALSSARDITDNRRQEVLLRLRLTILEFAASHSFEELLQKTLDEAGFLTASPIGFCHFVDDDGDTLSLQAWSTRTTNEFCRAEWKGMHYSVSRAGVWVDCIHEKKPVIHNDLAALPHRKGTPEGHPEVVRELVVPIVRSNKVAAVFGIGNKPSDYTEEDVEVVSYLADVAWEITMQKRIEEKRMASEESYRLLVRNIPGVVYRGYANGDVEFFDEKIKALTGYPAGLFVSGELKWPDLVHPEDRTPAKKIFLDALRDTREYVREYRVRRRDGQYVWVQERSQIVCDEDGRIDYISGVLFDLSERKHTEDEKTKLEAQFRQSQKMEAVGRLAGGVAHDFNNMLGVILGFTELALAGLKPIDPIHAHLSAVRAAATRSVDLTRQLLAFSRRQTIDPRGMNLNEQTRGMERLLKRVIGEDIDLLFNLSDALWPVYMDPAQVDQILANLAVNSRDAMPNGGKLTVETVNVTLDAAYCEKNVGFRPGDFVMLAVSDTGCGMSGETLEHIFEPFFTTKPEGKGTGLGLATVYGIVKQNNGFINVYSEQGHGTTVKVYIPRYVGRDATAAAPAAESALTRGSETILIVEDEKQMLELTRSILVHLGYNVLEAQGPGQAIAICEKYAGEIHLLLTDVVMPLMNGKELAQRIRDMRPGIRTIFMSGYTANAIAHRGILEKGTSFLQKPFSLDVLARKVREVLAVKTA